MNVLSAKIATDLINRLSAHLDYNINIMDDRGVIIASRDATRIGNFHEAACRIIEDNEQIESIYSEDHATPGVKPGVNLPIVYRGKVIGVVGITGNPAEVLNLAYAVKTSVESIIEYEMYKERTSRRQGIKNLFQSILLYDETSSAADMEDMACKLGYSTHIFRSPVAFRFAEQVDGNDIIATLKQVQAHSKQDICFVTVNRDILVYKAIEPEHGTAASAVKEVIEEYVNQVGTLLKERDLEFRAYVGSLQKELSMYRKAYEHVQWIMNRPGMLSDRILYFSDHIYAYTRSSIPSSVFQNIFSAFDELISHSAITSIGATIEALIRNNMNVKDAAAELSVHRNTLRSRLVRIQNEFGIDPVRNPNDREFLLCLNEYLHLPGQRTTGH